MMTRAQTMTPAKAVSKTKTAGRPQPAAQESHLARVAVPSVDSYIAECGPQWSNLLKRLRAIIVKAAPQADETLNWGRPWYAQDGLLCYFSAGKSHITFGFRLGAQLNDPDDLLEGTGNEMRHIKLRSAADIRPRQFTSWVREAVALNGKNPARSRPGYSDPLTICRFAETNFSFMLNWK